MAEAIRVFIGYTCHGTKDLKFRRSLERAILELGDFSIANPQGDLSDSKDDLEATYDEMQQSDIALFVFNQNRLGQPSEFMPILEVRRLRKPCLFYASNNDGLGALSSYLDLESPLAPRVVRYANFHELIKRIERDLSIFSINFGERLTARETRGRDRDIGKSAKAIDGAQAVESTPVAGAVRVSGAVGERPVKSESSTGGTSNPVTAPEPNLALFGPSDDPLRISFEDYYELPRTMGFFRHFLYGVDDFFSDASGTGDGNDSTRDTSTNGTSTGTADGADTSSGTVVDTAEPESVDLDCACRMLAEVLFGERPFEADARTGADAPSPEALVAMVEDKSIPLGLEPIEAIVRRRMTPPYADVVFMRWEGNAAYFQGNFTQALECWERAYTRAVDAKLARWFACDILTDLCVLSQLVGTFAESETYSQTLASYGALADLTPANYVIYEMANDATWSYYRNLTGPWYERASRCHRTPISSASQLLILALLHGSFSPYMYMPGYLRISAVSHPGQGDYPALRIAILKLTLVEDDEAAEGDIDQADMDMIGLVDAIEGFFDTLNAQTAEEVYGFVTTNRITVQRERSEISAIRWLGPYADDVLFETFRERLAQCVDAVANRRDERLLPQLAYALVANADRLGHSWYAQRVLKLLRALGPSEDVLFAIGGMPDLDCTPKAVMDNILGEIEDQRSGEDENLEGYVNMLSNLDFGARARGATSILESLRPFVERLPERAQRKFYAYHGKPDPATLDLIIEQALDAVEPLVRSKARADASAIPTNASDEATPNFGDEREDALDALESMLDLGQLFLRHRCENGELKQRAIRLVGAALRNNRLSLPYKTGSLVCLIDMVGSDASLVDHVISAVQGVDPTKVDIPVSEYAADADRRSGSQRPLLHGPDDGLDALYGVRFAHEALKYVLGMQTPSVFLNYLLSSYQFDELGQSQHLRVTDALTEERVFSEFDGEVKGALLAKLMGMATSGHQMIRRRAFQQLGRLLADDTVCDNVSRFFGDVFGAQSTMVKGIILDAYERVSMRLGRSFSELDSIINAAKADANRILRLRFESR